MARAPLILAAVGLLGCGELSGLAELAPPLAEVRGRLEGAPPATEAPLLAALVWADDIDTDPFCAEYGPNPLNVGALYAEAAEVGCASPFRFVPGRVAATAPVEDGRFVLELPYLPSADDMRGLGFDRIAWGSVVVFEDVDRSGVLEIVRAKTPFFHPGGGGRQSRGEKSGAVGHQLSDPAVDDRVFAASFTNLLEDQQRVAFREGAYGTAQFHYPDPCRGEPPEGFSLLTVVGDDCRYDALYDAEVVVEVRQPEELRDVACGLPRSVSRVLPELDGILPPGLAEDCLGEHGDPHLQDELNSACAISCIGEDQLAIADRRALCPGVLHFGLCEDPKDCKAPPRPDWWSCHL